MANVWIFHLINVFLVLFSVSASTGTFLAVYHFLKLDDMLREGVARAIAKSQPGTVGHGLALLAAAVTVSSIVVAVVLAGVELAETLITHYHTFEQEALAL